MCSSRKLAISLGGFATDVVEIRYRAEEGKGREGSDLDPASMDVAVALNRNKR